MNDPQGLFAPPSLLNAVRRAWAEQAGKPTSRPTPPPPLAATVRTVHTAVTPTYSVKVAACQSPSVLGEEMPREVILTLAPDRDEDLGAMAALVGRLADRGFRRFECADLTSWQLLRDLQPACDAFEISADWTWYAANAEAVRLQESCGIAFGVTGPEANLPNLLTLPEEPPREVLVAGFVPLFIAETPPLLPNPDGARLSDRNEEPLRVVRVGRHWVTFSERPWSATDYLPELARKGRTRASVPHVARPVVHIDALPLAFCGTAPVEKSSTKTQRDARAWTLHRSALRPHYRAPPLRFSVSASCIFPE